MMDYPIWHPFTQHSIDDQRPVIKSARGVWLYPEGSKPMMDCISSWWTILHGHCHPVLMEALRAQTKLLDHVMFAGFTHPSAINLAHNLLQANYNQFAKVFFSDNGSTAVEVALKIAFQYWYNQGQVRPYFLCFNGGYHGDTFGAMAVGKGSRFFTPYHNLCFQTLELPWPDKNADDVERLEAQVLEKTEIYIRRHHNQIAGLIIEPLLQGAGGMRFCRPEFLQGLGRLLRAYDILQIYDEVAVGFGRLGYNFAWQAIGEAPDLLCLSKGITGGILPLSVTLVNQRLYNGFLGEDFQKALPHGHSFTANPLACSVALASLELLQTAKTQQAIRCIENCYRQSFLPALEKTPYVHAVQYSGSVIAISLRIKSGYQSDISRRLREFYQKSGFNIRPLGEVVYLMPPYCITEDELLTALEIIQRSFWEIL